MIESKIEERSSYVEGLIMSKYTELEGKYNEKQGMIESKIEERSSYVEELLELEGRYNENRE